MQSVLTSSLLLLLCGIPVTARRIIGADGKVVIRPHHHHVHMHMLNKPVVSAADNVQYGLAVASTNRSDSAPKSIAYGISLMRAEKCAGLGHGKSPAEALARGKCSRFMSNFCDGNEDEKTQQFCEQFFAKSAVQEAATQHEKVPQVESTTPAAPAQEEPAAPAQEEPAAAAQEEPQPVGFHAMNKVESSMEKAQETEEPEKEEEEEEAKEGDGEEEEKEEKDDESEEPPATTVEPTGHLHMDASKPQQEQGFHGKLIKHEDGDTLTKDWRKEFGPKSGQRRVSTICKEHPENPWCQKHAHDHDPEWWELHKHMQSSAVSKSAMLALMLCIVGAVA